MFLRAGRPNGGRLWRISNLNWSSHSNRGVGFFRLFVRLERGRSTALPILFSWTLGSIMEFSVSRVTPIPPFRAPINRIPRPTLRLTAPIISTIRFRSLIWFPTTAVRALGFPVRQPCFKTLLCRRRIHILRHQYVLSRGTPTWARQASRLRRRLEKGQRVAQTCQRHGFFVSGQCRVLRTQDRNRCVREPGTYKHARFCLLSQHFGLRDVRVHILARAFGVHKLRHILENRVDGVRREAFARNPRNLLCAIQVINYIPTHGQTNLPGNIRHM